MTHEQEHEQQVMATVDECVALAKEVGELREENHILRTAAIETVESYLRNPPGGVPRLAEAIAALDDVLVGAEPAERRNTTAGPVEADHA